MTTPQTIPSRMAVAAFVSDEEFQKLSALEVYDVRRVEDPENIRALYLSGAANGAFVGAGVTQTPSASSIFADLIKRFPGHRVVALLDASMTEAAKVATAYQYGRLGVHKIVVLNGDLTPVRTAFDGAVDNFLAAAVARLTMDTTEGFRRFLTAVFRPDMPTARKVASRIGVHNNTMLSRFYRAKLPSPKTYVAWARLAYAAHLGQQPGHSVATIAHILNASSPQSFGRFVRLYTGYTAAQFREKCDGAAVVELYRQKLLTPYADTLRDFDPLVSESVGNHRVPRAGERVRKAA
jgi:AraC-like DNA-binding protein